MDLCNGVDTHLARTIPRICATNKFDAQIHGNVRRCGAGLTQISMLRPVLVSHLVFETGWTNKGKAGKTPPPPPPPPPNFSFKPYVIWLGLIRKVSLVYSYKGTQFSSYLYLTIWAFLCIHLKGFCCYCCCHRPVLKR